MNRFFGILLVLSLLLCSCGEEGKTSYKPLPAVSVKVISVGFNEAEVEVKSINADKTMYLCLEKGQTDGIQAKDIVGSGHEVPSERFMIKDLIDNNEYHLLVAAADAAGNLSSIVRDTIYTPNNPANDSPDDTPTDKTQDENGMYWWERTRTSIPEFADMALCYGGHKARNPQTWTKDRFRKTVIYTDKNGKDHWFFDSMLMLEIWDDNYKVTYSIANDGKNSSKKAHWEKLLDYWFAADSGFKALDECIAEAAVKIGTPKTPRYIVFALPDPVYFENYSNGASGKNRNTIYWGEINGVQMDFSKMDHRLQAYKWYIDEIRERFAQKDYKYIQLLGFYILSETLSMKGTYRYEYKQHEELIPMVAEYCHSRNEGLYWIPYSVSAEDAGHNKALQNWKMFGFDLTILQPNYYWDDKSWATTCEYINTYDMRMEFEFEGSHGGSTSILGNSTSATRNKARFREYMINAEKYGIYGKKPIVLYTGTNALYELATSETDSDKEIYHEFGGFIINSPLKK